MLLPSDKPNPDSDHMSPEDSAKFDKAREEAARQHLAEVKDKLVAYIMDIKAKSHFVVMDKERTTLLKDPGMERPFMSPNQKQAELIAREAGGVVETAEDALRIIIKHLDKKLGSS